MLCYEMLKHIKNYGYQEEHIEKPIKGQQRRLKRPVGVKTHGYGNTEPRDEQTPAPFCHFLQKLSVTTRFAIS